MISLNRNLVLLLLCVLFVSYNNDHVSATSTVSDLFQDIATLQGDPDWDSQSTEFIETSITSMEKDHATLLSSLSAALHSYGHRHGLTSSTVDYMKSSFSFFISQLGEVKLNMNKQMEYNKKNSASRAGNGPSTSLHHLRQHREMTEKSLHMIHSLLSANVSDVDAVLALANSFLTNAVASQQTIIAENQRNDAAGVSNQEKLLLVIEDSLKSQSAMQRKIDDARIEQANYYKMVVDNDAEEAKISNVIATLDATFKSQSIDYESSTFKRWQDLHLIEATMFLVCSLNSYIKLDICLRSPALTPLAVFAPTSDMNSNPSIEGFIGREDPNYPGGDSDQLHFPDSKALEIIKGLKETEAATMTASPTQLETWDPSTQPTQGGLVQTARTMQGANINVLLLLDNDDSDDSGSDSDNIYSDKDSDSVSKSKLTLDDEVNNAIIKAEYLKMDPKELQSMKTVRRRLHRYKHVLNQIKKVRHNEHGATNITNLTSTDSNALDPTQAVSASNTLVSTVKAGDTAAATRLLTSFFALYTQLISDHNNAATQFSQVRTTYETSINTQRQLLVAQIATQDNINLKMNDLNDLKRLYRSQFLEYARMNEKQLDALDAEKYRCWWQINMGLLNLNAIKNTIMTVRQLISVLLALKGNAAPSCSCVANQGLCLYAKSDGTATTCWCNSNYYGEKCEKFKCPGIRTPSLNDGAVTIVSEVGVEEESLVEYFAAEETKMVCSGRGTCDTTKGTCTCTASNAYHGPANACELLRCGKYMSKATQSDGTSSEVDNGECGINVSHGKCDARLGICQCRGNYYGDTCEKTKCPDSQGLLFKGTSANACSGLSNGRCVSSNGSCVCKPDFSGRACEKNKCPLDCSSADRGVCNYDTGKCTCKSGFFGEGCEQQDCPRGCSSGGTCNNVTGICICNPGFSGPTCAKSSACELEEVSWTASMSALGWSLCPEGSLLRGFGRLDHSCTGLFCLVSARCGKPCFGETTLSLSQCTVANWWTSFDMEGLSTCPGNTFMAGLWRNKCSLLYCLEAAKCCSVERATWSDCARVDWWESMEDEGYSMVSSTSKFLVGLIRSGSVNDVLENKLENLVGGRECSFILSTVEQFRYLNHWRDFGMAMEPTSITIQDNLCYLSGASGHGDWTHAIAAVPDKCIPSSTNQRGMVVASKSQFGQTKMNTVVLTEQGKLIWYSGHHGMSLNWSGAVFPSSNAQSTSITTLGANMATSITGYNALDSFVLPSYVVANGVCVLSGQVTLNSTTGMFTPTMVLLTLPTACRPSQPIIARTYQSKYMIRVGIDTAGNVTYERGPNSAPGDIGNVVSLNGITIVTATSATIDAAKNQAWSAITMTADWTASTAAVPSSYKNGSMCFLTGSVSPYTTNNSNQKQGYIGTIASFCAPRGRQTFLVACQGVGSGCGIFIDELGRIFKNDRSVTEQGIALFLPTSISLDQINYPAAAI